ncbi:hypothetical protein GOBAR_DD03634 [Gossypium barbadense]|nr:hypothetical protein GOBAR_DD03634 [Gossypium barbadense]
MLDFWVKFKEIDLYVEHEVNNPIIVDEMFLLTTGEGDVEGVEVDGEGDDDGVESYGESDLERVKSVGESDFRVYFGEDNDSEVTADEYASDFATSDRVDNVVAACSGVEEDWNKTEVWDLNEPGSLVGSDEDEEHENGERMRTTIKDHPKMKLRRIQRICAFEMHGLEIAISDILPRVEHRNCARHVFAKWSGRKLGKSYEYDFWHIVK